MTAVQMDRAWRNQLAIEVTPLDRPRTTASELEFLKGPNPISQCYGQEPRPMTSSNYSSSSYFSGSSYFTCTDSRASLSRCGSDSRISYRHGHGSSHAGSRLKTAGSRASKVSSLKSAGASSMIRSQACRSSVLSVELEHEREMREKAEKEVETLKARLTQETERLSQKSA
eukprot:TRINITY_DN62336_c0_g1_i1.p1 TRINITY_DN62336_c0_g1~~TRINITY_DN62336_c0_g1_i1.p1  ORF type:complete len:171 (+),score=16.87 TRINITY_DN62336_c0_g1_i1:92-604(+)